MRLCILLHHTSRTNPPTCPLYEPLPVPSSPPPPAPHPHSHTHTPTRPHTHMQANCVTEIPAFQFQGAIQRALPLDTLLHLVLLGLALRLGLYAALPLAGTPWAVLPVELLHGLTFGIGGWWCGSDGAGSCTHCLRAGVDLCRVFFVGAMLGPCL